jgi:hypothetical protein
MQSHENYIYCIFQQYLGIDLYFGKSLFFNEKLISLNFLKLNQYILQIKNLYKFRENLSKNEVDRTHDS